MNYYVFKTSDKKHYYVETLNNIEIVEYLTSYIQQNMYYLDKEVCYTGLKSLVKTAVEIGEKMIEYKCGSGIVKVVKGQEI